jgi:putative oxidoreductase
MKHVFTAARILLGLIFLVFSLNYWLQFIPIPGQPEGSHGANFMGAIFMTKFLTVVKVLELVSGVLLLSGRYVNLGLTLLGPIIISIALFHLLVAPGNYGLTIVICVLALVTLIGQKDYVRAIFAK